MHSVEAIVVDYGVGNVGSIINMLAKMGHRADLSNDPDVIAKAPKIILPGVGSFDTAVKKLEINGLNQSIVAAASSGTPLLGVCLGMQLLLDNSEEGSSNGLGLIPGTSKRFNSEIETLGLRIPQMGWNEVERTKESIFVPSLGNQDRYYFVHSFFVSPTNSEDTLGITNFGGNFSSAIERENILGVQFHPEKSHKFGGRLLSEFVSSN